MFTRIALLVFFSFLLLVQSQTTEKVGRTNRDDNDKTILPTMQAQSPINLNRNATKFNESLEIDFVNYEIEASPFIGFFNGETVLLSAKYTKPRPEVEFNDVEYTLDNLHFHWGTGPKNGSEHSIDGKHEALELHFNFYSQEFESMERAQSKVNGVLAVAVLFRQVDLPNFELNSLIQALDKITNSQSNQLPNDRLKLHNLLPKSKDFFTYIGSNTLPPFYENVRWIVFAEPVEIGKEQLNSIRRTSQHCAKGLIGGWKGFSNSRDLQPLNDRIIESNFRYMMNNSINSTKKSTNKPTETSVGISSTTFRPRPQLV